LGLLEWVGKGSYQVRDQAQPILDQVSSGSETPMAVLAASLLEDDVQRRLPGANAVSSSEAMMRQARMVVHELGNTLKPVQMTLARIYREAARAGIDRDIAPYRERVDRGIERMLAFARELQDTARLHEEVADVFDPVAALRDAIGIIQAEGHDPRFDVSMSLPAVMGVRARFVLAVADIVRNAYRAAPPDSPRVTIEGSVEHGRVHIAIDDNGPGIAPEQRDKIFMNGYSTRDDSAGHGLALARATIEDDMNGTLSCVEGSALGGARFVITLPAHDPGSAR
jgi:signal transduction histidine kinase